MNRHNFIDGNQFKYIADMYVDEDKMFIHPEELEKKPKIIFIKGDWIERFKIKILPHIDWKFKLISHNADTATPLPHIDLLQDDRVIHWYGMNANLKHDKFTPIPIGVANDRWEHGNKNILQKVIDTPVEKIDRVYCNFDCNTNPIRYDILEQLKQYDFIDFENTKLPYEEYLLKLKQYKWTVSPPGNSVDCHRIWESIYLGVTPIVQKNIAMDTFKDLPIHFVDSWENITIASLKKQYKYIVNKDKLNSNFLFYKKDIHE